MKLPVAALMLLCAAAAFAEAPAATAPDSLDRAVATFVANNFKLALDNAFDNLEATGVRFDRAAVRQMIVSELTAPYDSTAARKASEMIESAVAAVAVAESESMLRHAAATAGAQTTAGGVVIVTVNEGSGARPTADGSVTMRYTGSLPDGHVFDAISADEQPMTAPVGQLTPGMAEALPMLKAGGKYILYIPAALAYGKDGIPGVIPADCALKFEIDLISTSTP